MSTNGDLSMPRCIILLGSGESGKEVTIELKRPGCQVITVDSYPDTPTMQLVDDHRVIDMSGEPALRRLLEETKPDLVIPEVEAIATDELADLEEHSDTRIVPNAFAVQATMDRQNIRALIASPEGVRTSKFHLTSSPGEVREALEHTGLPAFIKPTISSSGHGQSRIVSTQETEAAWTYALEGVCSDMGRVIVEEEVDFDSKVTPLTIRSWNHEPANVATGFRAPIEHRQEHGDYVESWQPAEISPLALEAARRMAKTVMGALVRKGAALTLDLFEVEFFIKGEDAWSFELPPHLHNTGTTTIASQSQSEFELHARATPGLPISPSFRTSGVSAVAESSQCTAHPEYRSAATALGVAGAARIFEKSMTRTGRCLGVVLVTGATTEEARRCALSGVLLVSVVESREVE